MDEEEDIKKITAVLNKYKQNDEDNFEENYEYEEFINYGEISDTENEDCGNDEENYILPDFHQTDLTHLNTYDPSHCLKSDEKTLIEKCHDHDLKNLLLLNRNKNMQLIRLYKKIKDVLVECQSNIVSQQNRIKMTKDKTKRRYIRLWNLGAPYFKDDQLYPCPMNVDAMKKKQNGELSYYEIMAPSKWSCNETDKLVKGVLCNYNVNRIHAISNKIREIKNKLEKTEDDNLREQLDRLEERLKELEEKNNDEVPPLNDDKYVDWDRIADAFFNNKYSATECKCLWTVYMHPDINKSPWTDDENMRLKTFVAMNQRQNWEMIVKSLGTNRSPFIACLHYFSNVADKFKKAKFTTEEDDTLLELVEYYKRGNYIPFVKIAQHFNNRSRAQLFYRYQYYLSSLNVRKGKFTEDEDVLLMVLVDRFGRNYRKCNEHFPTRSMAQLKARFSSNLNAFIKKGSFTVEEDEQILDHVKEHGEGKWAILTKKLSRCRAQLRQRYSTIVQYLQDNPGSDVKDVVRRKHVLMKSSEDNYDFLRYVADKYKNTEAIPTLQDIRRTLKQSRNESSLEIQEENDVETNDDPLESVVTLNEKPFPKFLPTSNIDDMLIDFFKDTSKVSLQKNAATHLKEITESVKEIMASLQVNLVIPENFSEDTNLDNLDITILSNLRNVTKTKKNHSLPKLIAPNLNTLVGMWNLLVKHVSYKDRMKETTEDTHIFEDFTRSKRNSKHSHIFDEFNKNKSHNQLSWCISRNLMATPEAERERVVAERNLFCRRFVSLFKLPALMTLETPSKELLSTSNSWKLEPSLQVKRTYSKTRNDDGPERKKPKTCEGESSRARSLTKITDKNLIERLKMEIQKQIGSSETFEKKSKKETLVGKNNDKDAREETNPNMKRRRRKSITYNNVINEEKQNKTREENNIGTSSFDVGKGELVVEENEPDSVIEDLEDIKKLDLLLKKESHSDDEEDYDI